MLTYQLNTHEHTHSTRGINGEREREREGGGEREEGGGNLQTISNLNAEGCFGSSGCLITLLLARGIVPVGRLSCTYVRVCMCHGDKRENECIIVYCWSAE